MERAPRGGDGMKAPTPLQQRAWDMQQAGMSLADIAAAEAKYEPRRNA